MDENFPRPVQTKMDKAFAEYVKTCSDEELLKLLEETKIYQVNKYSGLLVVDPERIFQIIPHECSQEEEFRRKPEKKLVCPIPPSRHSNTNGPTNKKPTDVGVLNVQEGNGGILRAFARFWRKLLSCDSGERGSYDKQETVRGHYRR